MIGLIRKSKAEEYIILLLLLHLRKKGGDLSYYIIDLNNLKLTSQNK